MEIRNANEIEKIKKHFLVGSWQHHKSENLEAFYKQKPVNMCSACKTNKSFRFKIKQFDMLFCFILSISFPTQHMTCLHVVIA